MLMHSLNCKSCEAVRKPINYSHGRTSTCEGENTLNKVAKANIYSLNSKTPTCEGTTTSKRWGKPTFS